MRTLLVLVLLAVTASFAQAQSSPVQVAQQQAIQQSVANAQLAAQNSQMVTQQAQVATMRAAQQGPQSIPTTPVCCSAPAKPRFSLKAGTYASGKMVEIMDSVPDAVIYFTTDGWTPTAASNRYVGPIVIDTTTNLQAVAIDPHGYYGKYPARSLVVSTQYTIIAPTGATLSASSNPLPSSTASIASADGRIRLAKGTPVPFVFAADVNSRTASIGDQIRLTLADDLTVDNVVVARKGLPAVALLTEVDKTTAGGGPGGITFQVDVLNVNGNVIKLRGFATKEGEAKPPSAAVLIPIAGPLTLLKHGADAQINSGAHFTAFVEADTSLPPVRQSEEPQTFVP